MNITLETLQAEVLRLSASDRTKLLDSLIACLDADAEAEAARDASADKREQSMGDAAADWVPLEEALSRLRTRFPG